MNLPRYLLKATRKRWKFDLDKHEDPQFRSSLFGLSVSIIGVMSGSAYLWKYERALAESTLCDTTASGEPC